MALTEDVPSITINDIDAGTGVKVGDNMYILVYKGTNNAYLLRDYVFETKRKMFSTAPATVDYASSAVDTYLTGTFTNSLSAKVRNVLYPVTIKCVTYNGSATGESSIQRSVFLLNNSNVGDSTGIVSALKKYYGTTNANTARVARTSSDNTARAWWLRDAYTGNTNRFHVVASAGTISYQQSTTANYVRPVISISSMAGVRLVDGIYVLA